jgi:magnesium chelatase family protein
MAWTHRALPLKCTWPNGLPGVTLVGLPETEVKEARDRVRAAILNSGFEFPQKRITINLAPADLPKESGRFDLPIALGILAASGQVPAAGLSQHEFAGELALSGELRAVRGALAMAAAMHAMVENGAVHSFVLPVDSAHEAALVGGLRILPAASLLAVCAHLSGRESLAEIAVSPAPTCGIHADLGEVKGQAPAKTCPRSRCRGWSFDFVQRAARCGQVHARAALAGDFAAHDRHRSLAMRGGAFARRQFHPGAVGATPVSLTAP